MRWLVVLTLALGGCVRLPGDGHFACGPAGECPGARPYCHADRRCYAVPEDDAGAGDGGGPSVMRCGEPIPACRGTDRCIREAGEIMGYCAPMGAGPGSCTAGVVAPDGFCRASCLVDEECIGTNCTFGRWEGDAVTGACAEASVVRPTGFTSTCATDAECPRPLQCVADRCNRTCDGVMDTVHCGPGEICGPVPTGGFVCLVSCSAGETCPDGTTCESPGGPQVCLPMMR